MDWLGAGLSRRHMQSLIRRGALVQMRYGVYATAAALAASKGNPAYRHALEVAAARAALATSAAGNAVASHQSAAIMHGFQMLKRPSAAAVTLTRPPGSRSVRRSPGGITFHAAALPSEHVARRFNVPVTTAARTAADIARISSFIEGVVVADSALHSEKMTKAQLDSVLSACAQWAGLNQARQVAEFSDARSESVLESCSRVVFDAHGLPAPDLQVELGAERFVGRVDFYWREYLTVAEADGESKYRNRADAIYQLERDRLLRAAGFRVVHFTWQELFHEPFVVIRRIRSAFSGEIS
jgi:Protein of unknown function (DUF559)